MYEPCLVNYTLNSDKSSVDSLAMIIAIFFRLQQVYPGSHKHREVFLSNSELAVEHTRCSQSFPWCPALHLQIALLFLSWHFPFPLQIVPFLSLGQPWEQVAPA
jgi:hypothetical protein